MHTNGEFQSRMQMILCILDLAELEEWPKVSDMLYSSSC